jgi:hypothetical protein
VYGSEVSDYEFDVFLSVKWDKVFGEWLEQIFIPLFGSYIRNDIIAECKRLPAKMFYYKKSLAPGDPWPDDLRKAIKQSRLAVALCSPEYFYSKWCLTEFHSFLERGKTNNARVLVPVSIHDLEPFPEEAQNLQTVNFTDFVIVGNGFKETKKYSDFQDELKKFSKRVAQLICKVPTFQEWPIVEKNPPGGEPELW